jgi:hypothetical protein
LPDNTEIKNRPLSDASLGRLIDQFDRDGQKILFALQCQFNSTDFALHCRPLVEVVFGFVSKEINVLFLKGLRRSLIALRPRARTVATVLLNNPEASKKEIEDVQKEDRELDADFEAMMLRVPEVLVRTLIRFIMTY